jgi:hypothetical protein
MRRFPRCRSESIAATKADKVMSRHLAISFSPFQNASSRPTLVLWPAMTMNDRRFHRTYSTGVASSDRGSGPATLTRWVKSQ